MAAINALHRVEELRLPQTLAQGGVRLVLFSHYHPRGWLQRCIRRELADLRSRGWQVLLLSDRLDAEALGWCEVQGIGWLRRRNEGRDFGAFQDGCLLLEHRGLTAGVERLILLNDSVYPVVDRAATSWPRFLNYQGPEVLGFSDSFQNGYHLQSYGLHLPGVVLQQSWWQSFWRHYHGWSGMKGAIGDGRSACRSCCCGGWALKALHPVCRLRGRSRATLLDQLQQYCRSHVWIRQNAGHEDGLVSLLSGTVLGYPLLLDGTPA